jgi:pimeloyl-ACP methyl ester carboxylesterase
MGFKDWGCWELVMDYFTKEGYAFCKYNVSHNGGTIDQPLDFPDLEAFAMNTYSKELEDSNRMIEWIRSTISPQKLFLIGHSRGGGILLLHATNTFISGIISWAGISSIANRFPIGDDLLQWKKEGVRYGVNMRTKQKMPHNYLQYEDFLANEKTLSIEETLKHACVPICLIHGDQDTSVLLHEGEQLAKWSNSKLHIIKDANHTFQASHPWQGKDLPSALREACYKTLQFIQTHE